MVKPAGGESGWVLAAAHVAEFVRLPLEREDSAVNESTDEIVRHKLLIPYELLDIGGYGGVVHRHVSRAPFPVLANFGSVDDICRKIDEIFRRVVLDIKICTLPLVGRLDAGDPDEIDASPRGDRGSTTLHHGFFREIRTLDNLSPKVVVFHPVVESWPEAEIGLEQAGIGRKKDRDIRRKMMGLEPKEIEEGAEKIAHWKP